MEIDPPVKAIEGDIADINSSSKISSTTKQALISARRGQGKFRSDLMQQWENRCAVTGCAVNDVLRASHIKAWQHSDNEERLDPANGLLLTANIDALFDRYLITFDDDGHMHISERISTAERHSLGVPQSLRKKLNSKQKKYMKFHQEWFSSLTEGNLSKC